MNVIEVGCGNTAGPYFEGATQHIITDISLEAVAASSKLDERFTTMVADSTHLTEVKDASLDVVLARNVFGDPNLGVETCDFLRLNIGDCLQVISQIERRKLSIMQEAARILIPSGKLIVVEQYTPIEAEEFFDKFVTGQLEAPAGLSLPKTTALNAVAPNRYANHHSKWIKPQTWVSIRETVKK